MLKSHLLLAWRNFFKNKTLSFINIFGLSVGMAFAILIGMWIQYERSFDAFHKNGDRIAMVQRHQVINDQKVTAAGVMLPLYDDLKTNYPEIKRITRMIYAKYGLVAGNNKFNKEGQFVDADFLKMFNFPLVAGNAETALKDPHSIILTQSLAIALFGKQDPVGKMLKIDNEFNAQVTGVMQDLPKNSSFRFEFLAPFEFLTQNNEYVKNNKTNWGNSFLQAVVEIKEGVSMNDFSKKIGPLVATKETKIKQQILFLHPLANWRLYDDFKNWKNAGGRIEYLRLFGAVGLFILLIACINFMNLSTARSEKRAKEVGIRKTVGSTRRQLIGQFFTESLFTSLLAFLLSLALINLMLPWLKDLGFENIRFDFGNKGLLMGAFAVCIVTGLVSGSYPALYLSSFLPVKVLKGVVKQGKGAISFRKVLVVSQFAISIGLIISTIIVFQQIQHAKNRSLGYNADNLVSLPATGDLLKNYEAFKQDLLKTGKIEAVAKTSSPMTAVWNDWNGFSWEGKDPKESPMLDMILTEWDYEKAAGLKFIAGRPFSRQYKTDSNAVILNEAALHLIGYKDPIGKTIKDGDRVLTIVGINENVIMRDPFKPAPPTVIMFTPNFFSTVLVRFNQNAGIQQSLGAVQSVVEKYNPAFPFEYSFVDEDFRNKFSAENQVAKLAGIFAALAISISCMGLFGLALFMAEHRSKEISIRKVLGASLGSLWLLLSKEFIGLVVIACFIASPLAFWLMSDWLEKYEYRIEISWLIFVVAGSLALLITLLTVSAQAIKASIANPVNRLKME